MKTYFYNCCIPLVDILLCLDMEIAVWDSPFVFHVGDVIRKLRLTKKWGVEDLADAAGVNKMTVSAIERGASNFKKDTLDRLSSALGFADSAELYRYIPAAATSEAERTGEDIYTGYKPNDIPVIAEGHATPQPNLFWSTDGSLLSEVEDRMSRPSHVKDPHAYGIRVIGDSMYPRFKPGEKLIASPRQTIHDGDEVYVELLSGERLVKEARRTEGGWLLVSYNQAYPPRVVKQEEIGAIHRIVHIDSGSRGRRIVPIAEMRERKRRGTAKERHDETSDHPEMFPEAAHGSTVSDPTDDDWDE